MWSLACALAALAVASAGGISAHLKQVLVESNDAFLKTADAFYIPHRQSSGLLTYEDNYNFCFLEYGGQLLDLTVSVDEPSITGLPPLIQFSADLLSVRIYRQSTRGLRCDGDAHINLTVHCSYNTRRRTS